jgi:hypothetical protein
LNNSKKEDCNSLKLGEGWSVVGNPVEIRVCVGEFLAKGDWRVMVFAIEGVGLIKDLPSQALMRFANKRVAKNNRFDSFIFFKESFKLVDQPPFDRQNR